MMMNIFGDSLDETLLYQKRDEKEEENLRNRCVRIKKRKGLKAETP